MWTVLQLSGVGKGLPWAVCPFPLFKCHNSVHLMLVGHIASEKGRWSPFQVSASWLCVLSLWRAYRTQRALPVFGSFHRVSEG